MEIRWRLRERLVWMTRIEKGFLLNGESTRLWKDESLQKLERRRNTIFQGRGKISKCLRIGDISVNIVKRLERNFYD